MSNHVIKLILGLNLLLLITSCKRNNDGVIMQIPLRTVDCNINEAKKLTYFSEVCDSIIVIPLKDSNLIGFVDIIHLDDSGIYLTSNNILYAFNWAGDELYCLDRKGRASFDYLEIGDFAISNDYLVISDPEGKKILLEAAIYVAEAPKSPSVEYAEMKAEKLVAETMNGDVPLYLQDPNYKTEKVSGYKYPHSYGGWVEQQYLPDNIKDEIIYEPSTNGEEKYLIRAKIQKKNKVENKKRGD